MERKIEEHIKNLEEYCEADNLFEKDGDFKEFCDNHIADIKAVIEELKNKNKEIEELKEDNKHQWEERCKLTFELENRDRWE